MRKLFINLSVKLKDKINNNLLSNAILIINYTDCDAIYVGQTKRYVKYRLKEHQTLINKNLQNGRQQLVGYSLNF